MSIALHTSTGLTLNVPGPCAAVCINHCYCFSWGTWLLAISQRVLSWCGTPLVHNDAFQAWPSHYMSDSVETLCRQPTMLVLISAYMATHCLLHSKLPLYCDGDVTVMLRASYELRRCMLAVEQLPVSLLETSSVSSCCYCWFCPAQVCNVWVCVRQGCRGDAQA